MRTCPFCNTNSMERVPRGPVVKALFWWLQLKRYRCSKCWKRFYRRT